MANDSYSALSDPTRRRILSALRNGSRPVGELVEELEVSQPTVSKHLKVLRDTGLVATRAEGQKRFYSLEPQPLQDVTAWIEELLTTTAESAEPVAAEEPRNLPWFTTAQAVEEYEQDRVEAGISETSESLESEPEVSEAPVFRVIDDQNSEIGQEKLQELLEDSNVSNISTLPDAVAMDAEVEVTGASVGANTDVISAESSAASDESDESNSTKPEFGIPPARSGGAHRRQSGLLSTLTGFRRRGRSSRR